MRVLFAVPYIFNKAYPEFTRNGTGFGFLVGQIYEYVGKEAQAYLTSHVLTKGHGNILPHTLRDVFCHLHIKDVWQGLCGALQKKQSLSGRARQFYYCINKGYLRHIIKTISPDVVHIHGVGKRNDTFLEVCREMKVPYVVTLHGLNGFCNQASREKEIEVLSDCEKNKVPVTVISTGIKRRIEEHYLGCKSQMITVVTNGTCVEPVHVAPFADLREKYHIPDGGRIAVSVGNLTFNKNQIQIVEAMALLLKKNPDLFLFLCGRDHTDGAVQRKIEELGLQNRVFALGFVPYEKTADVFRQAEMTVLASLDEGFGLSIIEGFVHGLPAVTFADLDAVYDLYDKRAMVLCENRSTEALADAMEQAWNTEWDGDFIKEYSKNFSLEKMAEQYCAVLRSAMKE